MHVRVVTTHPSPDLDALASAALLWWCLAPGEPPVVRFCAERELGAFDDRPWAGQYVVDVGRGPMDHHQLADPRSTCAFLVVAEAIQQQGTATQAMRAARMALALGPLVLRQDTTGRMFDDASVQALSLPKVLDRIVWRSQDDAGAWSAAWEVLRGVFDAVMSSARPEDAVMQEGIMRRLRLRGAQVLATTIEIAYQDEQRARRFALDDPRQTCDAYGVRVLGQVAGYTIEVVAGSVTRASFLREAIAQARPDVQVIVSVTRWITPEGHTKTYSCNIGRTPEGRRLDCRDLHARARAALPELDAELRRWHAETWFAGRGSLKYPRPDAPPDGLADALVDVIALALGGSHGLV